MSVISQIRSDNIGNQIYRSVSNYFNYLEQQRMLRETREENETQQTSARTLLRTLFIKKKAQSRWIYEAVSWTLMDDNQIWILRTQRESLLCSPLLPPSSVPQRDKLRKNNTAISYYKWPTDPIHIIRAGTAAHVHIKAIESPFKNAVGAQMWTEKKTHFRLVCLQEENREIWSWMRSRVLS